MPPRFRDQQRGRAYGAKIVQRKRFCDKANIPAEHQAPEAEAWFSRSDEDAGRPGDPEGAPGKRPDQAVGVASDSVAQRKSLRSRREFQRVIQKGRAARRNGITVFVGNYDPEEPRLGLAVRERKSAVRRNRVRRRLRAAAALCELPGRDVVISAEPGVADLEFQELVVELKSAVRATG